LIKEVEMIKDGYSICLNKWVFDKNIRNELGLLLIISSLSANKGYCFATNKYFSEIFGVTTETISRQITKLINGGYLRREIIHKTDSKEVEQRKLYPLFDTSIPIDENINTLLTKKSIPIDENVKENITSIITSSNNNELVYTGKQKNAFTKPTISELNDYIKEIGAEINAEKFYDYYEANGWLISGSAKMKDWKATVRNWKRREDERKKEEEKKNEPKPYNAYGY